MSLLYDLAGGNACRRGPRDHCMLLSFPCDAHIPHLSSLVRQSDLCSRPVHTLIKLTLIVPRAWEIGYTQPCIKCLGKSTTHFVYFLSRKALPYTHVEATSYIPQQGQSLHLWTTSLFTTGCYKTKYTIQFLWMACISRLASAILSGETELALGTVRVKHLPAELLREMCWPSSRIWPRPGTADDEFRSALCSVRSKTLSQTALHSRWVLD